MVGRSAGRLVAVGLLLGLGVGGCSARVPEPAPAPGGGGGGAEPAAAAPVRSAVADSFRSPRVHATVALPVRIRIPAAGVDTVLEPLGRAPDGSMGLPSRPSRAGWYAEGPRPGQPGPAVVVGHVDWDHGPAVFFHLAELRRGDVVFVDRADGSTARFRVSSVALVPKTRFPTDRVFAPTLEASLRLVTCGGSFDHATRNYRDNVIVFAVPV